jgi:Tfp pilus assembly protein PilF
MTTTTQQQPARYLESLSLFKAGEFTAARDVLEQCVQEQPEHIPSLVGLAASMLKLGDQPQAEATMRRVLALDPANIEAHLGLGRLAANRGQRDEAADHLRQILAIDPDHAQARRRLAALTSPARPQTHADKEVADVPATLSSALDAQDASVDAVRPGRVILQRRRRLASFRRLWLGIAALGGGLGLIAWAHRVAAVPAPAAATVPLPGPITPLPGPYGSVPSPSSIVGDLTHQATMSAALLGRLFGWTLLLIGILGIAGALVNAALAQYVVREHRLEITEGFLMRVRRIIWFYRVQDVRLVQDPVLMLAGTARLTIHVEETQPVQYGKPRWWQLRRATITGLGSTAEMTRLMELLHRRAMHERRGMKKTFI